MSRRLRRRNTSTTRWSRLEMRKLAILALVLLIVLVAAGLWVGTRDHSRSGRPRLLSRAGGSIVEFQHGPVCFDYARDLAASVLATQEPAVPFVADEVPDGVGPAHVEVRFEGFAGDGPHASVDAAMRVYPVADFARSEFGNAEINHPLEELTLLQEMLDPPAGRGSSGTATAGFMPYMPVTGDVGQVLHAKLRTIESPGVKGIRYLTAYSQEAVPLVEGQVFYTFQGLTADRKHYVAASFPIRTGLLPDELPSGFDPVHFVRETAAYAHETTNALDARSDDRFTPPLAALDELVRSIRVAPP